MWISPRSHMRHMRQMNNMMNSLFSDPFGMLGEGPLAIMGARRGNALMPFMPQMPSLNRLFTGISKFNTNNLKICFDNNQIDIFCLPKKKILFPHIVHWICPFNNHYNIGHNICLSTLKVILTATTDNSLSLHLYICPSFKIV